MSAAAFDTLATARELEAAGIERRQAEAIAEGMRRAVSADRDALATKTDLAALEARLTWRLVGIATAIVAAVKLIPGLD